MIQIGVRDQFDRFKHRKPDKRKERLNEPFTSFIRHYYSVLLFFASEANF